MPSEYLPCRIACLQPSATVILDALGELDRVVACTKYCADVVPGVVRSERLILADSWTANGQQIMAARPDLVVAAVPYQEKAIGEILRSGTRFLGLAPRTLEDIYRDIVVIAGTVGATERAEQVIDAMKARLEQMREQLSQLPRPRVFCEEWGKPIIASQMWVAELVEVAGGEFVGTPGKEIAAEDVVRFDPEVIVAAWCGAGDRVPLEKIVRERGWEETSAARKGRVFCVRDEFLNTPAPTLLQGLSCLAHALHPEAFGVTEGIRAITRVPVETDPKSSR